MAATAQKAGEDDFGSDSEDDDYSGASQASDVVVSFEFFDPSEGDTAAVQRLLGVRPAASVFFGLPLIS